MFETALKEMMGFFDKRFLSTIFLPCLVFFLMLTALVCYAEGLDKVLGLWKAQPVEVQAFLVIFYMAIVYLTAYVIQTFLGPFIRLYEGYPLARILKFRTDYYRGNLERMCVCRKKLKETVQRLVDELEEKSREHDKVLEKIDQLKAGKGAHVSEPILDLMTKSEAMNKSIHDLNEKIQSLQEKMAEIQKEMHFYYPPCKRSVRVLPTRFGNIMRGAELYPGSRYGLDGPLIWPRLYPLFPDAYKEMIAEAKSSIDALVNISILSIGFALAGGIYFLLLRHSWPLFLLTFCGGFILWCIACISATEAAKVYGSVFKAGFDLYRVDLLKTMRLDTPATTKDEKKEWENLIRYIYFEDGYSLKFAAPCPQQSGGDNSAGKDKGKD